MCRGSHDIQFLYEISHKWHSQYITSTQIIITTFWLPSITTFHYNYLWLVAVFIWNKYPRRQLPSVSSSFDLKRPPYESWSQTGHTSYAEFCQVVVDHSKRPSLSLSSGQGAVWTLCPNLDVQRWFVSSNQWLNHVSPTH